MPEHTSFFSYLLSLLPEAFTQNLEGLARYMPFPPFTTNASVPGSKVAEPLMASLFICVLIILLALAVRGKLVDYKNSVIPDEKLTLRTFFELFIGYFYDMMKDMMGAKNAKRYFPVVGTGACFVFFSNMLGLVPGFMPPTSTWTITAGCAAVVFVLFNYYGIKENGLGYFKHLAGPVWWLSPLIFVLEVFSVCLRPITLSIRLMLNMAVDHLLVSLGVMAFVLFVPIPVMVLSTLVIVVQTLVFCLLTSIYISLSTEHEDHGEAHGDAHGAPAH